MSKHPFNIKSVPAEILKQIDEFRANAIIGIEKLDHELSEKQKALQHIEANICLEETAALIEKQILNSLQPRRDYLQRHADSAKFLWAHDEIKSVSIKMDGSLDESSRRIYNLDLIPFNLKPEDALALLWSDSSIAEFAKTAAIAAGAKPSPEGYTVEQAKQLHEAMIIEISELIVSRKKSVDALSGLIDVALVPFVEKAAPPEPTFPAPAPTVMVQGTDGVMRPYMANEPFGGR